MRPHGLGLLLAIASIAAVHCAHDEEALTLTEANFDSEVDRSHVFVKFYVRPYTALLRDAYLVAFTCIC